MSNAQDQTARNPRTARWWIAAVVAVAAVIGALSILRTARPSPEKLQAAHDQGVAEAQIDDAAYGRQLAVAHAAQAAQAAAAGRAQTTETAARSAAVNAGAVAQDASATVGSPIP